MARVFILGADGMVGHVLRIRLAELGHDVFSVARKGSLEWDALDVEDEAALLSYARKEKPDFVVNCTGVLIKESEEDPLRAIRLNAALPHVLAKGGRELGFRTVQLSSDCVFSGKNGPYSEDDFRDADGVYGRTKALGELRNDRDLTIRTSKVGPELKLGGSGLFNWFMAQKGTINGFGKALWGGITTLELADFLDTHFKNPLTGLLHLTNGEAISKYELLRLFGEIWDRKDVRIERNDSSSSDRSLICSRTDFRYEVPSYRKMLEEMRAFMLKNGKLYTHYE